MGYLYLYPRHPRSVKPDSTAVADASERAISRDLAVSRPPGRTEVTSSTVAPLSSVKPTARVGLWVGGPQQTPTAAARQIDLVRD